MEKQFHTVAEELFSSEYENITVTSHDVVNNGWSILSWFPQQTVKKLEVIQEVILSEASIDLMTKYIKSLQVMNKK